jgi:endonuclease YncB( thermonuclease family)
MSRRVATGLVVILAAVLGARTVAGGDRSERSDGAGAHGTAIVTRVVDGDTAVLEGLGKARFIGVDTPEVYGGSECFGAQASAFAKRELAGQRVRYVVGREPRDRYGRLLVYLYLADGRFFNELLVEYGYARPLAIAPNVQHAARFERSARAARAGGRGLWSPSACR